MTTTPLPFSMWRERKERKRRAKEERKHEWEVSGI